MNKKFKLLVLSTFLLIFNGCDENNNDSEMFTLFLVDANNNPISNVSYDCDTGYGETEKNGAFHFYEGENCVFNFLGFNGTEFSNDYLYIVDIDYIGMENIDYNCQGYGRDYTSLNGGFEYNQNDICTFYF